MSQDSERGDPRINRIKASPVELVEGVKHFPVVASPQDYPAAPQNLEGAVPKRVLDALPVWVLEELRCSFSSLLYAADNSERVMESMNKSSLRLIERIAQLERLLGEMSIHDEALELLPWHLRDAILEIGEPVVLKDIKEELTRTRVAQDPHFQPADAPHGLGVAATPQTLHEARVSIRKSLRSVLPPHLELVGYEASMQAPGDEVLVRLSIRDKKGNIPSDSLDAPRLVSSVKRHLPLRIRVKLELI